MAEMTLRQSVNDIEPGTITTSLPLVLASASPRRTELLRAAGLSFETVPSQIDESLIAGSAPAETAKLLAIEKARSVSAIMNGKAILGADTVVALNGAELGKPGDTQEAFSMLSKLNGRIHTVYTGVCLITDDGQEADVCSTQVEFRNLTEREIEQYVVSGSPMDKAGSYGIQDTDFSPVKSITGSYTNVVGLPFATTASLFSLSGLIGSEDAERIEALESTWVS